MSFRLLSACAVLAAAMFGSACNDDGQPCDPDQIIVNHLCLPGPKPEAGPPDVQVSDDVETPDGEVEDVVNELPPPPPGMFGKTCTTAGEPSPDCSPPAPFCAIQPGQSSGYCSATGCVANPALCPPGWGCLQVPGVNFCTRPQ